MAFGIGSKEIVIAGSIGFIGFFGWLALKSSADSIGLTDKLVNSNDEAPATSESLPLLGNEGRDSQFQSDNTPDVEVSGEIVEACGGVIIGPDYPNLFRAIISNKVGGVWIDGYGFYYNESLNDGVPAVRVVVGSEEFEQLTPSTRPGACVSAEQ